MRDWMMQRNDAMNRLYYRRNRLCWLLYPIAMLYRLVAFCRRIYLQTFCQHTFPIPIIVVGNLTLGGVGKTPLVIALANALTAKKIRVGIVSRGYGANGPFPREVRLDDDASEVGDEPLLMKTKTKSPVIIAPKRVLAVQYLLQHYQPEVIISDDGLQHYAMGRDIEIVVIDGTRGVGNGLIFPAGPLRESPKRLQSADFVVVNSGEWPGAYPMQIAVSAITRLIDGEIVDRAAIHAPVAAVAAIGNPERFYTTLQQLKLAYHPYSFPDHYVFKPNDLNVKEKQIVMTEKDAVKCKSFATKDMYVVAVEAVPDQTFWNAFWAHAKIKALLQKLSVLNPQDD
jgi:tetraacyldisaccharide 4'-kinase